MAQEMPGGRVVTSSRVVGLVLEDGTQVDLGIRPPGEMKDLEGARVAAVGRLLARPAPGSPDMARPGPVPTLVDVSEVKLY